MVEDYLKSSAAFSALWTDADPPPRIRGYDRMKFIASGSMGDVYQAHQVSVDRIVAVKFLRYIDDESLNRFAREAPIIAEIRHPNIVQVFDSGSVDGQPYIVMEHAECNLEQHWQRQPPSPREVAETLKTISEAVQHAHLARILHRDLKPTNILLCSGRVVVSDFGLAKRLDDISVGYGPVGTPTYMAPEQRHHNANERSDIYALGGILFRGLTGRPPHDRIDDADISQLLHKWCPEVERDLKTICLKCLETKPENRFYTSAMELADDLRRFWDNQPIRARRRTAVETTWNGARKHPVVAGTFTVLLITLVAAVVALAIQWRRTSDLVLELRRDNGQYESAWDAFFALVFDRDPSRVSQNTADISRSLAEMLASNEANVHKKVDRYIKLGRFHEACLQTKDAKQCYQHAIDIGQIHQGNSKLSDEILNLLRDAVGRRQYLDLVSQVDQDASVLQSQPKETRREVLMYLARTRLTERRISEAINAAMLLEQLDANDPECMYASARTFAFHAKLMNAFNLHEQKPKDLSILAEYCNRAAQRSLQALSRAIDIGFRDFERIGTEHDFDGLRSNPEFLELIGRLRSS